MNTDIIDPSNASAAELPEIATLLSQVFHRQRVWLEELKWAYLDHPLSRSWWVNIRDDRGTLVGHSGLLPVSRLDDERFDEIPVWFSLNTAVRPHVAVPGLMIAGIRTLLRRLEATGPAIVLGAANSNSVSGFERLLGFHSLGPLSLTLLPPWRAPFAAVPRAVRLDLSTVVWRGKRPGADTYAISNGGRILRRVTYRGVPLDAVLTAGVAKSMLSETDLIARSQSWRLPAPHLYASFGGPERSGIAVPNWLRPSPLRYICRSLAKSVDNIALVQFLAVRRFEFIDFDVL